jgi:hypothetical protein
MTADRDDEDLALDARLAGWMAKQAPTRARRELLEAVLDRTRAMPRRRWVGRLGAIRASGAVARLPLMRTPIALRLAVVVLAIVALGGALVVGGRLLSPNVRLVAPSVAPSPWRLTSLSRVADLEPAGGGLIGSVEPGADGLIAVGAVGSVPTAFTSTSQAAAWTSSDGVTWTRMQFLTSDIVREMTLVGGHGSGLLAVGAVCPPVTSRESCAFDSGSFAPDGVHWHAVRWQAGSSTFGTPNSSQGYVFLLNDVTAGGPGYVMVGSAVKLAVPPPTIAVGPAVATSADGATWTWRVLPESAPSPASMTAVAAGGEGLVAVGTGASGEPAIWMSTDGIAWDPVSAAVVSSKAELDSVAAGPAGFVAVGGDSGHAAAWISPDGRTWRQATAGSAFDDAWMTRVTWTGTMFLAAGKTGPGDGAAWVSTDGSDWTRLDTAGIFKGAPIVAGGMIGSRMVLFGQDAAGHIVVAVGEG